MRRLHHGTASYGAAHDAIARGIHRERQTLVFGRRNSVVAQSLDGLSVRMLARRSFLLKGEPEGKAPDAIELRAKRRASERAKSKS
jgi:hypothetical protein